MERSRTGAVNLPAHGLASAAGLARPGCRRCRLTKAPAFLALAVLGASGFGRGVPEAAAAAVPPDTLLIVVKVSGAVQRTGGYQHGADPTHRCVPALEVPPAPVPGSRFLNLPFTVDFDSAARPPGNSFRLEIPGPPDFRVAMTAGGRFWTGDGTAASGSVQAAPDKLSGTFRISGLHAEGTTETITVEGSWTCPRPP